MSARLNAFLLANDLRIASNPCVSPDFCLDWPALRALLVSGGTGLKNWDASRFSTAHGEWTLVENPATGDHAWRLAAASPDVSALTDGVIAGERTAFFPASWTNLLALKNHILAHDPAATIFPSAGGNLGRGTLGVGARYDQTDVRELADKIVRVAQKDLVDSLKRVSVLAQDKMQPVKLVLSKDQLVVSCTNPETGEISDDVPVEYAGATIEVAFNARYLVEALASLDDKNVLLKVTDNLSPGLLVGVDEPRHLCVVMPMRL